ncbi:hypothetical protein JY97_09270 [Alkalispirochaeta odontotermitis]|nr:hypothetical protein JY97_09270 [Alkalispirochaeta odontotermitis]CAB1074963.1 hypothetical protein D1AOALGA4SA_2783 [Olavius algarvensis Delta 1 endosymbiont]
MWARDRKLAVGGMVSGKTIEGNGIRVNQNRAIACRVNHPKCLRLLDQSILTFENKTLRNSGLYF